MKPERLGQSIRRQQQANASGAKFVVDARTNDLSEPRPPDANRGLAVQRELTMLSSHRLIGLAAIAALFNNACGAAGETGEADEEPVASSRVRFSVAVPARVLGQNYVRFLESTAVKSGGQC